VQNNFGLDGMLFEVETIMTSINDDDPTPFLELVPLEGNMVGSRFIIGEFRMTDIEYDNGNGQLQYSTIFPDKTKEENDELLKLHLDTINKIVMDMITSIAKDKNE
jgi:hypothetical protein